MGYACPVCEDPQADAEHLANHLAFTAMMRGGAHEAWLDEHVPDWGETDETELGERVIEYVPAADYPQVFEDTTGHHDHGAGDGPAADAPAEMDARRLEEAGMDEATREALERARELTARRRDESETE